MKEELYKPSRFNYFKRMNNGELLLYNSLSCKLCRVPQKQSKEISEMLVEKEVEKTIIGYPTLIQDGYFVPAKADEIATLIKTYEDYYNDTALNLMILPTHKCNCRCVYCYEDFEGGTMTLKTQENVIAYVKKMLKNCSSLHVSWFGGEPLVDMGVIRNLSKSFIDICKTEKKRYSADITTNGTLLNFETFQELKSYRVLTYQITIDGTKETHDFQRPFANDKNSSYDSIIDNLLAIKNNIKSKSFRVYLRINLTKQMLPNLERYIDEMDSMFGNDSRFLFSIDVAQDWGGDRIESFKDSILTDENEIKDIYGYIRNLAKKSSLIIFRDFEEMNIASGCYVSQKNFITIDSSGRITKCAQESRHNISSIGDLSEKIEINEFEIAKWSSLNSIHIPEKCKDCFLLPKGCFRSCNCTLQLYIDKYIRNKTNDNPMCSELKSNIDEYLLRWSLEGKAKLLCEE